MTVVRDVSQLLTDLGAIRAVGRDLVSNLFASAVQLRLWAARGTLERIDMPGCTLLLRRDTDFCHLYFVASTLSTFRNALAIAPVGPETTLACDVIGRPTDNARIVDCLSEKGFKHRVTLARMARTNPSDADSIVPMDLPNGVECAQPYDAAEVQAFLERLLDRYAERSPEIEEIATMASRGGVLAYRVDGKIVGALLFDRNGLSAHLRYWWIDGAYRDRGIGSSLMRVFLHACRDARRIVLWVVTDNTDSVVKYEHYGFRRDGLVDQIMFRPGRVPQ